MPNFLLVCPAFGETLNPSDEEVIRVVGSLPGDTSGDDFVVLDKPDEEFCGISLTFMQACPHRVPQYEGMFLIEHRDGIAGRHFKGHIEFERVAQVFLWYRHDDPAWRDALVWRDISHQFPELHPALEEGELASSFFDQGEWQAQLVAKKQRDGEFWNEWDKQENSN